MLKMRKYLYINKNGEKNIKTTDSLNEIVESTEKETYVMIFNERKQAYKYFCTIIKE